MIVKSLWTTLATTGAVSVALAATLSFNGALTAGDSHRGAGQRNVVGAANASGDTVDDRLSAGLPGDTLGATSSLASEAGIRVVVIDAGHGGRDLGCRGVTHGAKEKEIALALALELSERLRERHPDIQVVLTRDRDAFVPLHERARIANRAQADLFLSLHCNALAGAPAVRGSESYVMGLHTAQHNLDVAKRENAAIHLEGDGHREHYDFDPDSPAGHITLSMFQHAFLEQSMALASGIETALGSRGGQRSRGVKQAGFLVLKETAMPSVLVETGYLTNADEEAYLRGGPGQGETVEALYRGIETYMRQRRRDRDDAHVVLATQAIGSGSVVAPDERSLVGGQQQQALVADPSTRLVPVPGEILNADQARLAPLSEPDRPLEAYIADDSSIADRSKLPDSPPLRKSPPRPATKPAPVPVETYVPPAAASPEVEIYVQLSASAKTLDTGADKWLRLGHPIRGVREGDYYKYQAGPFATRAEADAVRRAARNGDFPDAFMTAYRGGTKLSRAQLDALH